MRRRFTIKLILPVAAICAAVAAYAANVSQTAPNQAKLLSSLSLELKEPWFGGLSAVAVDAKGENVTVLTDRSHLLQGKLLRDDGALTGMQLKAHNQLRNIWGKEMKSGRDFLDSEGLSVTPDGTIYVSFEGFARVSRYETRTAKAEDLPQPRSFRHFGFNKALEGLANDKNGNLYTLPEKAPGEGFPVWRWNGRTWQQPFEVPKSAGYLPVGLDIGPDGRLYLLERKFALVGFKSRLRRWEIDGDAIRNETTLLTTPLGTHGNLEGLSVWQTSTGQLRAAMVSDNNFLSFQKSELVEYQLPR
ncbi:esterase-like activity of phytase family protein [Epibacterium sp. SM1969]|uniref:Esterase-like activity of phytase family protein n=1 Tax=Tritonibacter aquimaris TaxID=2663379 RepID=A0A844AVP1_9RHOB|nr:esterase-like activity of phytase family protein [Tritonibacter aquimaris]MQY42061.1 esterase-like activity of phytase family protein [Tritonibacter aquimaris]